MVTKNTNTTPESMHSTAISLQGLTIILLILSLIANIVTISLLTGFSFPFGQIDKKDDTLGIKQAMLDLEYEKVGGKENYDVLQEYSLNQIKQGIGQIKESLKNGGAGTPAGAAQADSLQSMSVQEAKGLLTNAYVEWSSTADIAVIEYSEMECPFCAQQYHDTKVREQVRSEFGDKASFVYKSNRWVNHPGTEAKALGLLCAGKIGGGGAYTKFYSYVMDNTTLRPQKRDGTVLSVEKLPDAARAAGIDVKAWQSCLDKKETSDRFAAETAEAQKYWLGGTPGTLIVNVKTGKYATIEGAYPYSEFQKKIASLLQ